MRLRIAALAMGAALSAGCAGISSVQEGPRNIILFVGGGMGFNTLTATRIYAVGESGDLAIDTLPESAFVKTWSNDMQVTDEAAAMSAMLTGHKTNNGALAMSDCASGGKPVPTLMELAAQRGMGTGLVSNVEITDAMTAAAFVHSCRHPGSEAAAAALRASGIDVALGGDAAKQPNLPQMTVEAIERLSRNGKGFVLLVSNGLIDRAAHGADARAVVEEAAAQDRALRAAIDTMQQRDPGLKHTLIVATASHDSTLVLNGYSTITGRTTATEPGVLGLLRRYGSGKLAKDLDGAPYTIIGFGNGPHRVDAVRPESLDAKAVASPDYRYEAAVRNAPDATSHGGTDVYLGAIGAGAERFRGTIDNTDVFKLIKAAAGL
ncbi:alkaline phosphatase [Massilia endophytica]|uniref:alkaline phosphatase n=1 Tax=Massilia endophytica TaxID=2899220 RepID=UPI001E59BE85|nr:alkaline phosphatase [Massilia endophytica]UGQ45675.1 alkaline phosphatase [Massilia endophytica]